MEPDFWNTFLGAASGAGIAFLIAYVKDRYDLEHRQMTALRKAQMTLASHARHLQTYKRDFIEPAKQRQRDGPWYVYVPISLGTTPDSIDPHSLAFLLDRRFLRKCQGFENSFVEIMDASNLYESTRKVISEFESAKRRLQERAVMRAESLEELLSDTVQTAEFPREALASLIDIKSALAQLDEKIDEHIAALLSAFRLVEKLFFRRWQRASGIQMTPFEESATTDSPRERYGAKYV